ncbi:unnamed protein product [Ectocarpus sp. 12 AP-2014]
MPDREAAASSPRVNITRERMAGVDIRWSTPGSGNRREIRSFSTNELLTIVSLHVCMSCHLARFPTASR